MCANAGAFHLANVSVHHTFIMYLLQVLLDANADLRLTDCKGQTAGIYACRTEDTNILKLLLENGLDPNTPDEYGISMLMEATFKEKLGHAQILLEYGSNIDQRSKNGETALIWTAVCKLEQSMEFLLTSGASVNLQSFISGKTALLELLSQRLRTDTGHQLNCLDLLFKHDCDASICDDVGSSAIMYAATQSHSCLQRILRYDPSLVNKVHKMPDNTTALLMAIRKCHTANVKLLLEHGASTSKGTPESIGLLGSRYRWGREHQCGYLILSVAAGISYKSFHRHVNYQNLVLKRFSDDLGQKDPGLLVQCCRKIIRSHLLQCNVNTNLFLLARLLPLPQPVIEYLLYNVNITDFDLEESSPERLEDVDSPPQALSITT